MPLTHARVEPGPTERSTRRGVLACRVYVTVVAPAVVGAEPGARCRWDPPPLGPWADLGPTRAWLRPGVALGHVIGPRPWSAADMAPETRLPSHDFFLARSDHEKYVYVHTRGVVSCMSTNRFFISNSLLRTRNVCAPCVHCRSTLSSICLESTTRVTGPSLTNDTSIIAPKIPSLILSGSPYSLATSSLNDVYASNAASDFIEALKSGTCFLLETLPYSVN